MNPNSCKGTKVIYSLLSSVERHKKSLVDFYRTTVIVKICALEGAHLKNAKKPFHLVALKLIDHMIKFRLLAFVWMLSGFSLLAQDPVAQKYGNMITQEDLKEYLSILASDALEGRETGKRGQKMAAAFIRSHFEELGLAGPVDGSYFQLVELYTSVPGDTYVKVGQNKFLNFEDIAYYGSGESGGEISAPAVFVGKGRKEDFDQVNVEGKAVIVLMASEDNFRAPLDLARERKAKMTFLVNPDPAEFKQLMEQFKSFLSGGMLSLKKPEINSQNPGVFFI
jgi:hypothetical protein